jgi:uncharacterized protein
MRTENLPVSVREGCVVPRFLAESDLPWLAALLELVEAHAGARWGELESRLRQPVRDRVPRRRQELAVNVIRRLLRGRVGSPVPPRRVRRTVFRLAVTGNSRDVVMAEAGKRLGIDPSIVEQILFADLPGERFVTVPSDLPQASELQLRANLLLAQVLVSRASSVTIRLRGNARSIVRAARLRGLICTVASDDPAATDVTLDLSGPLSLFRRTTIYGRALGGLLPALAWADSFELFASCELDGRQLRLLLQSGDPFMPAVEPERYDSAVERHLARNLMRRAPDWVVTREPEPVPVGRAFIFPDFSLVHRHDPARRWLLEVIGFWTPEYLESKLRSYRQARLDRLILCIDEARACAAEDVPRNAHIIRYRKRVDVDAVLAVLALDTARPRSICG